MEAPQFETYDLYIHAWHVYIHDDIMSCNLVIIIANIPVNKEGQNYIAGSSPPRLSKPITFRIVTLQQGLYLTVATNVLIPGRHSYFSLSKYGLCYSIQCMHVNMDYINNSEL